MSLFNFDLDDNGMFKEILAFFYVSVFLLRKNNCVGFGKPQTAAET
jgi:hypothetical protein